MFILHCVVLITSSVWSLASAASTRRLWLYKFGLRASMANFIRPTFHVVFRFRFFAVRRLTLPGLPVVYVASGSTISRPRIASRPMSIRYPISSRLASVSSMGHVSPPMVRSVEMTMRHSREPPELVTQRRSSIRAAQRTTLLLLRCKGYTRNLTQGCPSSS